MTKLCDFIDVFSVFPSVKVNSKKQLLQEMAENASSMTDISERIIFDTILQRERLGSTGIGNGIAIPHGKLKELKKISGLFTRLETPVDFESPDNQPVDLVFLLLAPNSAGAAHLKALSFITRIMQNSNVVNVIRKMPYLTGIEELFSSKPPIADATKPLSAINEEQLL